MHLFVKSYSSGNIKDTTAKKSSYHRKYEEELKRLQKTYSTVLDFSTNELSEERFVLKIFVLILFNFREESFLKEEDHSFNEIIRRIISAKVKNSLR